MHYARLAAGTALIGGQKSVDVVHAYILLALYPVPSRKWEDDRSWIYLGVAIRYVHFFFPPPCFCIKGGKPARQMFSVLISVVHIC